LCLCERAKTGVRGSEGCPRTPVAVKLYSATLLVLHAVRQRSTTPEEN
jgi:hypothetical protein